MVAKGFGKKDSDRVGKEKVDRPMLKASSRIPTTGMIGGTSNVPASEVRNASKGSGSFPTFKRGGGVSRKR